MFSGKPSLRHISYAGNKFVRGCRNATNPACYNKMKAEIESIANSPVVNIET
jgi:hypothetical protein